MRLLSMCASNVLPRLECTNDPRTAPERIAMAYHTMCTCVDNSGREFELLKLEVRWHAM